MISLSNGFELRELSEEEFTPIFEKYAPLYFSNIHQTFMLRDILNEVEKEKLKRLKENMGSPYHLRIAIYKNDNFVGFHWGFQEDFIRFYMCCTAIVPEFRGQGIYTELLPYILKVVSEKGFQEITSFHSPSNNGIIVPKLKAGFVITTMDVSDNFGVLVKLTYYPNKLRNKIMSYRTGYSRPDEEIKVLLKL